MNGRGKNNLPKISALRGRRTGASALSSFERQQGQATIEYVLLLSIVGVLGLSLLQFFNGLTSEGITKFNVVLEHELSPGSFNEKLGQWKMAK